MKLKNKFILIILIFRIIIALKIHNLENINSQIVSESKFTGEEILSIKGFLYELLINSLQNENIFLIVDEGFLNDVNWMDDLVKQISSQVIISSLQSFKTETFDETFVKGDLFNVVIIFDDYSSIFSLNSEISKDYKWNPNKLFVVSLDLNQSLNSEVFDSGIQRSRYIFIVELSHKKGIPVIKTYSLSPYELPLKGYSKWKIGLGLWNKPRSSSDLIVDRLSDFHGKVFGASGICLGNYPYVFRRNSKEKCKGSNIEALKIISKQLNFKYKFHFVNLYGNKMPNGSWSGIFGDSLKYKRHIIINSVGYLGVIYQEFDVSKQFDEDYTLIMSVLPKPIPDWRKIVLPFPMNIWAFLFLTFTVVIILVLLALKVASYLNSKDLTSIVIKFYKILLRQDLEEIFNESWIRLWIVSWMLFAFLITNLYTANLRSYLTLEAYPYRIETVKELLTTDKTVITDAFFTKLLRASSNPYYRALGRKASAFDGKLLYKPWFSAFLEGEVVYVSIGWYLRYLEICEDIVGQTYFYKEKIFKNRFSLAFPKYGALTRPVTRLLNRLSETGIYQKLMKDFMVNKDKYTEKPSSQETKFTLSHLQSAFFLLFGGLSLSLLVFACELLQDKKKKLFHFRKVSIEN